MTGGTLPAALAADWLVSAFDQNAAMWVMSPAAAMVEEITAGWLLDLLGLPAGCAVGFVTGAQMANFSCLAAARHALLAAAGWDAEADGLRQAPELTVIAGEQAHATLVQAVRLLGLGSAGLRRVPADDQGRMTPAGLRRALEQAEGPALVCAQAGEVNTGAFDPLGEIAALVRDRGQAWLHVDGAFGLWAAASPALRSLAAGAAEADSWATDGHKWLNVPYDCGMAIVRDPAALTAALGLTAAYLPGSGEPGLVRLHARGVPAGPGAAGLRRAAVARPRRRGRAGGAVLRAGPAGGQRAVALPVGRGAERRGAEPGAAAGARGRHRGRDRAGAAGRDLLAGRDELARRAGHQVLGVQLVDHRGRHPAVGRRHHRGRRVGAGPAPGP